MTCSDVSSGETSSSRPSTTSRARSTRSCRAVPRRACSGMPERERLGLYIVPDGLIGALWLQFARAVERDSQVPAVRRVRHLVRARTRHGARRQALSAPRPAGPRRIASGRRRQRACTARVARSRTSPASWTAIPTPCAAGSSARARLGRIAPERDRIARAGGGGVGAHTSFGIHDLDRCLAGANALAPDLMTAEERLTEVAQILAAGLLRLRRRQYRNAARRQEKNRLDFSPDRSGHATARQRRQVRR